MFTDVAGYTELAQADEAGALRLVREHEKLVRPLLAAHRGRKVKSLGDGLLLEFSNALDAVECGVELQRRVHELQAAPALRSLKVRVGIHLGDVQPRGKDILGDSVNIASRVEPLAGPGEICISEQVFAQVRNKLPYQFDRLGPRLLKGVRGPLCVYRVVLPWSAAGYASTAPAPARLAVLPLTNISPDPNDGYFADGLTEELITVLSQIKGLRVISRTSMNQYRGTRKSVSQIGSELGADSVLEGSVRKAGDQLRIAVQLIDTQTDEHRWAQTYDRTLENVFAIQAEVAEQTAVALRLTLLGSERKALQQRPTTSLVAYEHYLRGIQSSQQAWGRLRSEQAAVRSFEEAIRADPEFSAAHSRLANVLLEVVSDTRPGREVFPRVRELVNRALELDPGSSEAHAAAGSLAMQADLDWGKSESEFQRAIGLNPSSSTARFWYGLLLVALQRFDDAKHQYLATTELDPLWLAPRLFLIDAHLYSGDGGTAAKMAENVVHTFGETPMTVATQSWAYATAGRDQEAVALTRKFHDAVEVGPRIIRACVLARAGTPRYARALLAELRSASRAGYVSLDYLAMLEAILGHKEEALELLERDDWEGDRALWNVYQTPMFDFIREDPRFVALLRSMNLPTTLARRAAPIPT